MAVKARTAKRYTVAQKRALVRDWKAAKKNGMTFRAFCARRRVSETSMRNWMNFGFTGTKNSTRSTSSRRKTTTKNRKPATRRTAKSKTKPKAKRRAGTKPARRSASKAKSRKPANRTNARNKNARRR